MEFTTLYLYLLTFLLQISSNLSLAQLNISLPFPAPEFQDGEDQTYFNMTENHERAKRQARHPLYRKVEYYGTAYQPQRMAICINYGGYTMYGAYGYRFLQEPIYFGGIGISTNKYIHGLRDNADQQVYRTARLDWKIKYLILFQNDAHYLLRLMFAEISETFYHGRSQHIRFHQYWTLKGSFSPEGDSGGKFRGREYFYYPIVTNNVKTLTIFGQSVGLRGPATPLEILNDKFLGLAIINGLCLTSFYKCTAYCNNPGACNYNRECYYDYKRSHCIPKSQHERECRGYGRDKQRCEEYGCNFCCAKLRCQPTWETLRNCNDECRQFCMRRDDCQASGYECQFNPSTQQCTDKPYDKEQCPTYELLAESLFTETYLNKCGMDEIRDCVRIPYGINLGARAFVDDASFSYIGDPYPIQTSPYVSDIDFCGLNTFGATLWNRYIFSNFRRLYHKHCIALPIPEDGDFTVIIKFVDWGNILNHTAGRVFDIFLNDILIKENVNILEATGFRNRYEIVQPFGVRDNVKRVDCKGQSNRIKATRIHLRFVKKNPGNFDFPQASAIQVVRTKTCHNDMTRPECLGAGCLQTPSQHTCVFLPEIQCDSQIGQFCDGATGIDRELTTERPWTFGCVLPDELPYPI
ncbi:unnamed protein product [Orchesella dallaii]|uniref:Malectin domain-containing protein n=1 Tax=Orchesella dallaii TaxID=48710 RepID=A0ABP1S479_9HEXA